MHRVGGEQNRSHAFLNPLDLFSVAQFLSQKVVVTYNLFLHVPFPFLYQNIHKASVQKAIQTISNLWYMLDPVTWRHVTGSFSMNTKPPQKLLTGSTYVCTRRKLIQPLLSQLVMYNCELCRAFTGCGNILPLYLHHLYVPVHRNTYHQYVQACTIHVHLSLIESLPWAVIYGDFYTCKVV